MTDPRRLKEVNKGEGITRDAAISKAGIPDGTAEKEKCVISAVEKTGLRDSKKAPEGAFFTI